MTRNPPGIVIQAKCLCIVSARPSERARLACSQAREIEKAAVSFETAAFAFGGESGMKFHIVGKSFQINHLAPFDRSVF